MNTQEVIAKLNKYKEMLEQETDTDVRGRYASKISQLEASLKEAEEKVEKLEEKVQSEEKKELSEAEKKINKYKEFLDGESDPDVKARYQKRIKELQESLKEVKEEIKEEKKEVAEQKVEIKKAIKAVKSVKATKVEKKEAIQKVEKKVRERKEVSVKRTRRSKKIKQIISDLDKLIERNKKLKQKYTGKNVDVERDASRAAKPFGYRFVGKHDYRVPTKAQIKSGKASGKVVYEGRPNRSDVFPKGQKGKSYAKLADGGEVGYSVVAIRNGKKFTLNKRWLDKREAERLMEDAKKSKFYSEIMITNSEPANLREELNSYSDEKIANIYSKMYDLDYSDVIIEIKDNREEREEIINDIIKTQSERFDIYASRMAKGGKTPIVRTQFEEEEFEYGHGGHTQGYDDREDERLGMKHGRISSKDLKSSHARRDDARFEERGKMARGGKVGHTYEDKVRFAKPAGWRWKNTAVKKKIINQAQLSKSPTKAMREKYPNYVYFEDRLNKADKNPSRKYLSE